MTSRPFFRQALVAAEDAGFDTHVGLSVSAIVLRLSRDLLDGIEAKFSHRASRPAGASTLTQQLARNLFPEAVGFRIGDISLERKIKEAIVAVQIEKRYTKREILTLYANQMLFGHGTYGVEAAAHLYFGKSAKESDARRGRASRRDHSVARAPESLREHGRGKATPRVRAAAHGGRGLHHTAAGRGREQDAHRPGGSAEAAAVHCAVLHRRNPKISRAAVRREGAVRERPVGHDDSRSDAAAGRQPRPPERTPAPRQRSRLSARQAQRD